MPGPVTLIVVGILLLVVSLTVDFFGWGPSPGIGWKQALGAIVGFAIAVFGVYRMRKKD